MNPYACHDFGQRIVRRGRCRENGSGRTPMPTKLDPGEMQALLDAIKEGEPEPRPARTEEVTRVARPPVGASVGRDPAAPALPMAVSQTRRNRAPVVPYDLLTDQGRFGLDRVLGGLRTLSEDVGS